MMKSLAEYVMSGRRQAMIAASLATFSIMFAWVGAAIVALVVLRVGWHAATWVIVAAVVPAILWAIVAANIGPVTTVICVALLAQVLRLTRSWGWLLVTASCLLSIWGFAIIGLLPNYVDHMLAVDGQMIDTLKSTVENKLSNMSERQRQAWQLVLSEMADPTGPKRIGAFVFAQLLVTLLSIMLARWWQSLLYNPGGFREEFHGLRLDRVQVLLLIIGVIAFSSVDGYEVWARLFAFPILLAGIALVHGLVSLKGLGVGWLIGFYIAIFALMPLTQLVMMLAIIDSAVDFRSRLRNASGA